MTSDRPIHRRCVVIELHPVTSRPPDVHPFGLTDAELSAEIRRCRAAGWRRWELLTRFGRAA